MNKIAKILSKNEHSDLILVLLIWVGVDILIIYLLEIICLLEILFELWSPLFNLCNWFEVILDPNIWWICFLRSFRSTVSWWLDTWLKWKVIYVCEWVIIEACFWVFIALIVFIEYLRVILLKFSYYSLSVFDLHQWRWKRFYCH